MAKFNIGDRVEMTDEVKTANPNVRVTRGVVLRYGIRRPDKMCIIKDGHKAGEWWHESAWQPLGTRVYAIQNTSDSFPVAFGASVIAAWNAAERCLGDSAQHLQDIGYQLVEGDWEQRYETH